LSINLRILLTLVAVTSLTGATCIPRPPTGAPLPPPLFQTPPTFLELAQALNDSSSRVRLLYAENARISGPGMPTGLRAEITLERPRRFRLRGKLLGPEIDLGSNDELLWFWANRDPQNAVYFARHAQRSQAGANAPFPIEPEWLVDAFGLVELAPHDQHDDPFPVGTDQVEVRSRLARPNGDLIRRLVIHIQYGWVLQQEIYNSSGQLLVRVAGSKHLYDSEAGVSLPHRIDIELPPAQLTFRIEVGQYSINQLLENPDRIWEMPPFEGERHIDLAANAPPPGLSDSSREFTPYESANRTLFRPRYRGDASPNSDPFHRRWY
jgi:hypothetical protein